MNYALIFAGGIGSRMTGANIPKQFMKVKNKPIIIYTIEKFENCDQIDGVIIVCIQEWINQLHEYLSEYNLKKVIDIIPGGKTGQESIWNGLLFLNKIEKSDKAIVLIHDAVRPLIDNQTILMNIHNVKEYGSCITCSPSIETVIRQNENKCITDIFDRNECYLARAPQSFYLKDIYKTHLNAQKEGYDSAIDSATLMNHYNFPLYTTIGPAENIKITTPSDYYSFKAYIESNENN